MKKRTAVLTTILGLVTGAAASGTIAGKTINQKAEKVNKFKSYYNMLNQWLILKQEGKSLEIYFKENNYATIAIYGMGEMGNRLYDELRNSDIKVKYAIDKNASYTYSELEVLDCSENLEEVDAVIISAVFDYEAIEAELEKLLDCPIISLEDVVYEI